MNAQPRLTLLNFEGERIEKRRKYIEGQIAACRAEIELNQLAIQKHREDLARLGKRR